MASELLVEDGAEINAGTPFARGYLDPKEVLKIGGLTATQRYILTEAQKVYESQGIAINDKHFEVILRKMSDKIINETSVILHSSGILSPRPDLKKSTVRCWPKGPNRLPADGSCWVSPKQHCSQIHGFQLHPSKKRQKF
jgi:hypothetical protein